MAKLSKLTENSSARDAVNALNRSTDERLVLTGGDEGQAWRVEGTGYSGAIPLTSHNAKNLKVALRALIRAVEACDLSDD
jgi:hypothetical protein